MPPYICITLATQYKVPRKYTRPVTMPSRAVRKNDRVELSMEITVAVMSGVSAIQAKAGYPNFGKLAMRQTPESTASA
jgi:hypothetical protein